MVPRWVLVVVSRLQELMQGLGILVVCGACSGCAVEELGLTVHGLITRKGQCTMGSEDGDGSLS